MSSKADVDMSGDADPDVSAMTNEDLDRLWNQIQAHPPDTDVYADASISHNIARKRALPYYTSAPLIGIKQGATSFTVPEIADERGTKFPKRVLPEDGTWVPEGKYPGNKFGPEWMKEEISRRNTIESHPDYRFLSLVAGASNTDVERLFDQDSVGRVMRNRLMERQAQIAMQETAMGVQSVQARITKFEERLLELRGAARSIRERMQGDPIFVANRKYDELIVKYTDVVRKNRNERILRNVVEFTYSQLGIIVDSALNDLMFKAIDIIQAEIIRENHQGDYTGLGLSPGAIVKIITHDILPDGAGGENLGDTVVTVLQNLYLSAFPDDSGRFLMADGGGGVEDIQRIQNVKVTSDEEQAAVAPITPLSDDERRRRDTVSTQLRRVLTRLIVLRESYRIVRNDVQMQFPGMGKNDWEILLQRFKAQNEANTGNEALREVVFYLDDNDRGRGLAGAAREVGAERAAAGILNEALLLHNVGNSARNISISQSPLSEDEKAAPSTLIDIPAGVDDKLFNARRAILQIPAYVGPKKYLRRFRWIGFGGWYALARPSADADAPVDVMTADIGLTRALYELEAEDPNEDVPGPLPRLNDDENADDQRALAAPVSDAERSIETWRRASAWMVDLGDAFLVDEKVTFPVDFSWMDTSGNSGQLFTPFRKTPPRAFTDAASALWYKYVPIYIKAIEKIGQRKPLTAIENIVYKELTFMRNDSSVITKPLRVQTMFQFGVRLYKAELAVALHRVSTEFSQTKSLVESLRERRERAIRGEAVPRSTPEIPYEHRRGWVEQPEHSGIVRIDDRVAQGIGAAWGRLQRWAPNITNKIDIEFAQHDPQMQHDFAELVAVEMSLVAQRFPKQYLALGIRAQSNTDLINVVRRFQKNYELKPAPAHTRVGLGNNRPNLAYVATIKPLEASNKFVII